jgi:hypothetical protein
VHSNCIIFAYWAGLWGRKKKGRKEKVCFTPYAKGENYGKINKINLGIRSGGYGTTKI